MILHATCIAIGGRAVLLSGRSGAGKSDLALRLLDRGAQLVSDDYTELTATEGMLVASPPPGIAGKMEVRGVGILEREYIAGLPVCLLVDLDGPIERMPEPASTRLAGIGIPSIALNALEASAPLKIEAALDHFGLEP